ncbi:hypothetical protein ACFQ48_12195 [Hymenobacter caeli]|uniref:Nucleic acid-binding Zn-ribbon protein n=1 Tax=Hymenobacter caeli TaxID=2735894 RepID=A0ABX2FMR5_9BACT|nr:hypothetical protein [Hymenobacter caeli]NRT18445.1 putative nucleic acid-binding Zn-ribbon protein [Hymenobacter caeli]
MDNKDLPLVVAEILIEMHEVRTDIKEMRGDIKDLRKDVNEMRGDIGEMRDEMKGLRTQMNYVGTQIGGLVNQMERNRVDAKQDTERLIHAMSVNMGQLVSHQVDSRIAIKDHETRIGRLEQGE